jgi:hypothetical protein
MDKDLKEYRQALINTVEKLNESYDKLIITLSGGALALSLAFLKDVIKDAYIQSPEILLVAWGLFVVSLTSILGSLLFGIAANKKAVLQVDADRIYTQKPGGIFSELTTWLHYAGAFFLIIGLVFIAAFAYVNMEAKYGKRQDTIQTNGKGTSEAGKEGGQDKLGFSTSSAAPSKTKQEK